MREPAPDSPNQLAAFVEKFSRRKIVVIGDVVADCFLYGAISRISREAPVFILRHEQTETLPGGAANAAVNIAALGAKSALLGVVGVDAAGKELDEKLGAAGVSTEFLLQSESWRTTTKTRIFAGQPHAPRQQVIRIDYENDETIGAELQNAVARNLQQALRNAAAVIVSDYNYGVAGKIVFDELRRVRNETKIPIFVDSRFRLSDFAGATGATPNEDEVEQLLEKRFSTLEDFAGECGHLREKLGFDALLVTRGKNGMMLLEKENAPFHLAAVGSLDAVDVTGAGDTVTAAFALSVAAGASFRQAANIANYAGGLVVMKRGTATISQNELADSIRNQINAGK